MDLDRIFNICLEGTERGSRGGFEAKKKNAQPDASPKMGEAATTESRVFNQTVRWSRGWSREESNGNLCDLARPASEKL